MLTWESKFLLAICCNWAMLHWSIQPGRWYLWTAFVTCQYAMKSTTITTKTTKQQLLSLLYIFRFRLPFVHGLHIWRWNKWMWSRSIHGRWGLSGTWNERSSPKLHGLSNGCNSGQSPPYLRWQSLPVPRRIHGSGVAQYTGEQINNRHHQATGPSMTNIRTCQSNSGLLLYIYAIRAIIWYLGELETWSDSVMPVSSLMAWGRIKYDTIW